MKKNYNEQKTKKKDRFGILFTLAVVILSIILFVNVISLIKETAPQEHRYYETTTPEKLISKLEFTQDYLRMLELKRVNEALGVYVDSDVHYVVPYAICDYFEAAIQYRGYKGAGHPDASIYKEKMDKAKSEMGEYANLTEDIDKYVGLTK